ncbi:OmpA family protein [Hymenobacter artigasi]|uniref:Outer membrane protein OmpA-like peptidoglycan-associated protein n=1 Tax=Hymenobacter artigasi TaxID=2719616 RepID=A0ABX1HEW6_9BACT|nr:OmpA family protein [Hymenobacter artigasi]NKI88773.1 outer membrane protein OmpA-like peptidoglycan-associated protein [Hymenobacter artigasi]
MPFLNRLLLLLLCASATLPAAAQSVAFTKDNFSNDKDGLREANRELKAGDDDYRDDPPRYAQALQHFLAAQLFNPNNAALNVKIGDCYLNSATKTAALPYLQKAAKLDATADARTHYLLARALHLSAKWREAMAEYQLAPPVASNTRNGDAGTITPNDLQRRMQECRNGQQLMAHPTRVFIDNAGPELNSPASDYGPVVSADESTILITSRREGSTGGKKDPAGDGYFEDIYQSTWKGKVWSRATNLGAPVNTDDHNATVGLAPDGQRMLVYVGTNGGDLLETTLSGSTWNKPRRLNSRINTNAHETSASYSPDGRYLYFVSDRPGGAGGSDIYKVDLAGKNTPVSLGPAINTAYGEEGAFMAPDGKTLYFSSEGHNSMGGYDIFKSVLENGKWSTPENLGWPINTPDDDVFFVTSASGRHGYYSSERPGGLGAKDIYRITFLGPEKQPLLSEEDQLLASRLAPIKQTVLAPAVAVATAQVTILKGTVTDDATKQPVDAAIDLIDNTSGQTIANFRSNATSGRYLVSLPSGTNYGIVVRQDGYLFHSENFDLPAGAAFAEVVKDIPLKKLEIGTTIVLRNIFFDTGKATLRPESTAELERLQKLLTETPALKLEMAGHTDDVGEAAMNQDLSQRRAQAVVSYLTQHGIAAARLTAMGYGESKPEVPNTSKGNRQLNRRTEFKVTAK